MTGRKVEVVRTRSTWLQSGWLAAWCIGLLALAGCTRPKARVARSDHFDGTLFHNTPPSDNPSFLDVLRWKLTTSAPDWPKAPAVAQSVPPARVHDGIRITWVGHATLLVQTEGLNILTDPVWSNYVGPASFASVSRAAAPGVAFGALPRIDAVLLSHDHYDHFDLPTLARIAKRDHPRFFTGAGNEQRLARADISGVESLDWWQCGSLGALRVCATPARHNSGRALRDHGRTLWTSFHVSGPLGSVYFAGDTAWGDHFAQVRERLGAPCVALLPIGAYEPRWFMKRVHVDPVEAVRAHDALGARFSVAMHYATFRLSDEGMYEPAGTLRRALAKGRHTPFLAIPLGGHVTTRCGR